MKKQITIAALFASACALSAQTALVNADITTDTIWGDDETVVVLDGPIYVRSTTTTDTTLTILPGTVVRGQPRRGAGQTIGVAPGSLIVTKTGRIEALGNATAPIIFTTAAIDNEDNGPGNDKGNGIPDSSGGNLLGWTEAGNESFYDKDPLNDPLGFTAAGTIPGNTVGSKGDLDNDNTELWGGLVILGEAPTNLGTALPNTTRGEGYIEGLTQGVNTEYGGRIANDDSGILQYVSVRHGGDEIGEGNEINGITLAGVGFGTTIEYCEVYMNFDDGFEWFGGTVNGNHLVASYVGDDSFDGDQGWIGQVQFVLAVQSHIGIGVTGGDEGFEFDGDDSAESTGGVNQDLGLTTVPLPSYAFANFTIVGPTGATGYTNNIDANGRITLRNGFIGDLYNGYVVNATGSFLDYKTAAGEAAISALIDTVTVNDTSDAAAPTGTGLTVANFVFSGTSGLVGEDQALVGGLDPRPVSGFPAPAGISSSISLPAPFTSTTYVGAFPTSAALNLWTTGWTALNASGILVD